MSPAVFYESPYQSQLVCLHRAADLARGRAVLLCKASGWSRDLVDDFRWLPSLAGRRGNQLRHGAGVQQSINTKLGGLDRLRIRPWTAAKIFSWIWLGGGPVYCPAH